MAIYIHFAKWWLCRTLWSADDPSVLSRVLVQTNSIVASGKHLMQSSVMHLPLTLYASKVSPVIHQKMMVESALRDLPSDFYV